MTERWPRPDPRDDGEPIGALEKDHVDSILERLRDHRSTRSRHVEGAVLGQGGMGIVLEVRDADLRRPLALKRLHPKRTTNVDSDVGRHYLARFLQEAQVTGQLAHPGIPPVHELSIDDKGPFFTMPVIRGQNLDEVFAKARGGEDGWSLARALGVLLKVCEAMAFAHAKRVVHRDLKPENVRIGRFGEVYVMDWGLARVIGRDELDLVRWSKSGALSSVHTDREDSDGDANAVLQTLDGDVLGTPFYMAPEQARGDLALVGQRTDIYAVGGLLYLLLTGRAPYEPSEGRISPRTVLGLVLHGPPARIATLAPAADADLIAICEKAMAREVEARYASMEDLASDLEAWIDRRPIRASTPSVRHALRLFGERHKAAVATASAGAFALLAATTWFVVRITEEGDAREAARIEAQRRGDQLATTALLESAESDLWPAVPELVEPMELWLREVDALASRTDTYQRAHSSEDRAREDQAILEGIAALIQVRPRIEERCAFARSLRARTIDGHAARWEEVRDATRRDFAFLPGGLPPQPGLVPLVRDRASGLWEFLVDGTGQAPSTDGRVVEDSGIVLILLPGGTFTMGRQQGEVGTRGLETPHRVSIEPFFLAKHELTQRQWIGVMRNNPSRHRSQVHTGLDATFANPVDTVTWEDGERCARRLGLRLPTMAEWEFAARARSTMIFGYGDTPMTLDGYENVKDQTWKVFSGPMAEWDDGYPWSSPVGTFWPNAFGLYDMLGNVTEWCSDRFSPQGLSELGEPEKGTCAFRGGSSVQPPGVCRPSLVQWNGPTEANYTNGVRLARDIVSD